MHHALSIVIPLRPCKLYETIFGTIGLTMDAMICVNCTLNYHSRAYCIILVLYKASDSVSMVYLMNMWPTPLPENIGTCQ